VKIKEKDRKIHI